MGSSSSNHIIIIVVIVVVVVVSGFVMGVRPARIKLALGMKLGSAMNRAVLVPDKPT
jgi:hypothetical protein